MFSLANPQRMSLFSRAQRFGAASAAPRLRGAAVQWAALGHAEKSNPRKGLGRQS